VKEFTALRKHQAYTDGMMETIQQVMDKVPRENFLPSDRVDEAGLDRPVLIGYGQTNSQPSTVQAMLEWLDVKPGQKVLDIGSGSGWSAALLSHLVGEEGQVIAVETIPELVEYGKKNCDNLNISNITFHRASEEFGWPDEAPYDRILVSASATDMPVAIIEQLRPGGKAVIPVVNEIFEIKKDDNDTIYFTPHSGFAFVPLVGGEY
jgi:protein-L-isoaspartate(D-aspartate) O-methyltransferase